MIRGAFILAVGFSLGYGKALSDSDDIRKYLQDIVESLKETSVEVTTAPAEEAVEVIEVDLETENTETGETL